MKLKISCYGIAGMILGTLAVITMVWTLNVWMSAFMMISCLYCLSKGEKLLKEILPKPSYVVCAANRHRKTGVIVCGARHFDDIMRQTIMAMNGGEWDKSWNSSEQGFIDNFGNFLTRKEALTIALAMDQIRYKGPGFEAKKILYSENLY